MKKTKPIITVHMWTEHFLGSAQKALECLSMIRNLEGGKWLPDKWSQFEPIRNAFTNECDDQFIRNWTEKRHGRVSNSILFRKNRPYLLLDIASWRGGVPDLNYLWFDIDANEFAGPNGVTRLKQFITRFIVWSGAVYATAKHSSQHHYRSAPGNPLKRLDQLDWLSFFSPRYIDFFGEEQIRTCPFYSCESCANGILLTAAEFPDSPSMIESDNTLIALEQCLGSDAFATDNYPEISCRVPNFELSQTIIPQVM
jgi:hypothetical protein